MKRILLSVVAMSLCLAGCGSETEAIVVTNGPLIAAEPITVAPGATAGIATPMPRSVPPADPTPRKRPVITPVVTHRPVTSSPAFGPSVNSKPVVPHPMISPEARTPTAPTPPASIGTAAAEATRAMQAILPTARSGIEVFDRSTAMVLASQAAGQQVASMSVVKLLIALDILANGNWAMPDGATSAQLHRMLAYSDDQIANNLWTAGGGPAIVTRMTGRLGLTGTRPPRIAGEWGDTLITPEDVVSVYRYITDQLPDPLRELIIGALAAAPKIAADGFYQHFGIPDGMPNTRSAVKQGWGTSGSLAVMNSTGLVGPDWRYIVVILVSAPASSYNRVPAVVTAGAAALADLVSAAGP